MVSIFQVPFDFEKGLVILGLNARLLLLPFSTEPKKVSFRINEKLFPLCQILTYFDFKLQTLCTN